MIDRQSMNSMRNHRDAQPTHASETGQRQRLDISGTFHRPVEPAVGCKPRQHAHVTLKLNLKTTAGYRAGDLPHTRQTMLESPLQIEAPL
jgi:hypothetical protein